MSGFGQRAYPWFVSAGAIAVAMLALVALAGWFTAVPALVQLRAEWAPMQFSTAFCLLLLGAGVLVCGRQPGAAFACGAVVGLIAALTLAAYIANIGSLPDWPFARSLSTDTGRFRGRMSPNTALALGMGAAALMLLASPALRARLNPVAITLGLGCALCGFASLLLYLFAAPAITGWRVFPGMALTTAIALTLIGLALAVAGQRHARAGVEPWRNLAPPAVGLLLLVVSLNLWQAMTAQSQTRLNAQTADVLERTRQMIDERIAGQVKLMQRMARRWSAYLPAADHAHWEQDAELLLAHFPYIDGLGLTDERWIYRYASYRGGPRPVIGTRADRDAVRRQVISTATARREVRLTPALELIQGGLGFVIVAPVERSGRIAGLALAGVLFAELLKPPTTSYPSGFAYSVSQGGRELYRSAQGAAAEPAPDAQPLAQQAELPLPGATWHVAVWPTPEHVDASTGLMPYLVLLFGVVTALLAWTSLWIAQVSAVRNRELSQMTHILESQVAERRRAEAEIRTLNAELEERVRKRTRELEETNQELESFSYSVSHDLRAPLASIAGFSKMLMDSDARALGPEGLHYVQRIATNVTRMGQIIDDLLDLARVSRSELALQDIDLSMLARSTLNRLLERESGRRIEHRVAEGMRIRADLNLMTIALENLLSNALKFTAKCEAALIEVGCEDRGGRRNFFVRDNGVGFDTAYAGKLFGVFQRLHSSSEFPGNGIGLATVKRVMARHHGEVWASSEPDRGAVFFFWLPD